MIPEYLPLTFRGGNPIEVLLPEQPGNPHTQPQKIAPLVQAALFVGDVLLALSNRETRDFFSARSKIIAYYARNGVAFDCFLRNDGWKKMLDGTSEKASPRERAAMFASLANMLVLVNTAVTETYASPVTKTGLAIIESLPFIANVISYGSEITRIGFHGYSLYADKEESAEKFARRTSLETAAKVAAVASSTLAIGGVAASWLGLTQVSSVLCTVSGVFGGIKFLAAWNENRQTTELQRLKQEMVTAFTVFEEEVLQHMKDKNLELNLGHTIRSEIFELRNLIDALHADQPQVSAALQVLDGVKKKYLGLFSQTTVAKVNGLIMRTTLALSTKLAVAAQATIPANQL